MSYSEYLKLSDAAHAALQEMDSEEILQGMEEHIDPRWKEEMIEAVGRRSDRQRSGWVDPMAIVESDRDARLIRIEAAVQKLVDERAAPVAGFNQTLAKIELLTDGNTLEIARNATDEKIDLNAKMMKIARLDSRFAGYTSTLWADLLDCSEGWVRKQPCWKALSKKHREPD